MLEAVAKFCTDCQRVHAAHGPREPCAACGGKNGAGWGHFGGIDLSPKASQGSLGTPEYKFSPPAGSVIKDIGEIN